MRANLGWLLRTKKGQKLVIFDKILNCKGKILLFFNKNALKIGFEYYIIKLYKYALLRCKNCGYIFRLRLVQYIIGIKIGDEKFEENRMCSNAPCRWSG